MGWGALSQMTSGFTYKAPGSAENKPKHKEDKMKDDPVAVVDEEKHAQLQHDQINAAYKSGIRKCIDIAVARGCEPSCIQIKEMEELLKTLYC